MNELSALRKQILADGFISADDVTMLRNAFAGSPMTIDKADFLFRLKDSINHARVAPQFKEFFVEAISEYILGDEESPGEIDENEAKWLRGRMQASGHLDRYDKALIKAIKEHSINFPEILNFKSRPTRWTEWVFYSARYLTIIAVVSSLVAAMALFIKGFLIVKDAILLFIHELKTPNAPYEEMMEMFVSSVDVFLFGMVLIIFGVGVYELFITKIDPVLQKASGRPAWMHIKNVDDLKSALGRVILMVLIVIFFKYSLKVHYTDVTDLLKLSVGIVLIALSLYITHKGHDHKSEE